MSSMLRCVNVWCQLSWKWLAMAEGVWWSSRRVLLVFDGIWWLQIWRHKERNCIFESFVESRQPFCFAPKSRYMTANSSFMTSDIIHLHGVFKTTMPQGWSGLLLCHSWSFGFPFTCQMDMLSMVTMLITLQCGGFVVAFIGALFLCYCCWLPGSCGWCVPWVGRWSIKEDMGVALSRLVSWCFARKGGSGSHGLFQIFLRTFWRLICGV